MRSTRTIKHLRRYLEQREKDLAMLRRDLMCRPFTSNLSAPQFVIAVDWSEISAYVVGGRPTGGGSLVEFIGDYDDVASAHQVALTVMFDRAPVRPMLLLPPYQAEMKHFAQLVLSRALSLDFPVRSRDQMLEELRGSPALNELLILCEDLGKHDSEERVDVYRSRLNQRQFSQVTEWINEEFGALFLLARMSDGNVLPALKYLRSRSNGSVPRVISMEGRHAIEAELSRGASRRLRKWHVELERIQPEKKRGARLRDAQALAYLSSLNTAFHDEGCQLVFVTRSQDMQGVIEDNAGYFACLSDCYHDPYSSKGVATISRSWTYFFELGVLWKPDDEKGTAIRVTRRLSDVRIKLEFLRNSKHASRCELDRIRDEFRRDVQNAKSWISTERPWLPDNSRTETDRAIRMFISFVTDPREFDAERERVRRDILESMQELRKTLTLDYSEHLVEEHLGPQHISLGRAFIRRLPRNLLLGGVEEPTVSKLLDQLHQDIRDAVRPANLEAISQLVEIQPLDQNASYQRLAITAVYACGAFERLQAFLDDRPASEPFTPWWALLVLFEADLYVAHKAPLNANSLIRGAWAQARQQCSEFSQEKTVIAIALLSCWLLLHLDIVEVEDENLVAFPRDPSDVKQMELVAILGQIEELVDTIDLKQIPRPLRYACRNNMLYAACRLTQMWGYRFEEIRHTRPVLEYLMDKKTTERVAKIKRQKNHSPENLDTLGYYHLKMAYYKGAQSAKGKAHVEHARKYLSAGLEHDGLSARTKSAIQGHLGLLDEVIQKAQ